MIYSNYSHQVIGNEDVHANFLIFQINWNSAESFFLNKALKKIQFFLALKNQWLN